MQRRVVSLVILVAIIAIGLLLVARRETVLIPSTKPLVVATLFPYYDASRIIAGSGMDVELLFPFGVGLHEATLTPASRQRLADADVIVTNGLGLEPFAKELPDIVSKDAMLLEASTGIHVLAASAATLIPRSGVAGRAESISEPVDPHRLPLGDRRTCSGETPAWCAVRSRRRIRVRTPDPLWPQGSPGRWCR